MRLAVNILFIITNVFVFFGMLAKFQHWPGASIGTVLGITLSIFAMTFYLIVRLINKRKVQGVPTYHVYFFFFIMAFGSTFFTSSASKDLLNAFTMLEHGNKNVNEKLKENSQKLYAAAPQDVRDYVDLGDAVISSIDKHKEELLWNTGGLDEYGIPLGKDNQDIASTYFLVSEGGIHGEQLRVQMGELNDMGETIMQHDAHKLILEHIETMPDPLSQQVVVTWQSRMVEYLPLGSVLANFELLKTRILQNQLTVLNSTVR